MDSIEHGIRETSTTYLPDNYIKTDEPEPFYFSKETTARFKKLCKNAGIDAEDMLSSLMDNFEMCSEIPIEKDYSDVYGE